MQVGVDLQNQTIATGLTRFFGLSNLGATAGGSIQQPPLPACTISNVCCAISSAQTGGSLVVTITNVDTTNTLVLTIPDASGAGSYQQAGALAFNAGDRLNISVTNNGAGASAALRNISLNVDMNGGFLVCGFQGNMTPPTTRYAQIDGQDDRATESQVQIAVPVACTLTEFRTMTRNTNGDTNDFVLTVRKNAADTELAVIYAANEGSGKKADAGSVSCAAGDKLAISMAKAGGTDSAILAGMVIAFTVP